MDPNDSSREGRVSGDADSSSGPLRRAIQRLDPAIEGLYRDMGDRDREIDLLLHAALDRCQSLLMLAELVRNGLLTEDSASGEATALDAQIMEIARKIDTARSLLRRPA